MIAVVLITTTMGGVPKMLAISISVLTRMMRAVLITRTMGGAKDIGDVDVSKNENDRGNTVKKRGRFLLISRDVKKSLRQDSS